MSSSKGEASEKRGNRVKWVNTGEGTDRLKETGAPGAASHLARERQDSILDKETTGVQTVPCLARAVGARDREDRGRKSLQRTDRIGGDQIKPLKR